MTSDWTIVTSQQHLYQTIVQFDKTIVLPRTFVTGNIHDYLFCYCPLVGILFEVLRIKNTDGWHGNNITSNVTDSWWDRRPIETTGREVTFVIYLLKPFASVSSKIFSNLRVCTFETINTWPETISRIKTKEDWTLFCLVDRCLLWYVHLRPSTLDLKLFLGSKLKRTELCSAWLTVVYCCQLKM